MFVEVHALDGDIRRVVGTGVVGDNGALEHPMNARRRGRSRHSRGAPARRRVLPLRRTREGQACVPGNRAAALHVLDAREHYHLPVKISPWGISVWRGA